MGLQYEGPGILFDVNKCVRMLLAKMFYIDNRTSFRVPVEFMVDEPWHNLRMTHSVDPTTREFVISISEQERGKFKGLYGIPEAEFEIIDPTPKQLKP